jgi:hypothetical protein
MGWQNGHEAEQQAPRAASARPAVAELARETWTADVLASTQAFQRRILAVSSSVLECRRKADIAGANDWLGCLIAVREHAAEEPLATPYANYLGLVSSTMADWFVCRHQYAEAIALITNAWETLDSKDKRRESLGLPAHLAPPSRWRLLGVLCDIKWRVPLGEYRDVIMTPVQHAQAWITHGHTVQARMEEYAADPSVSEAERQSRLDTSRKIYESVLWAGLWTASCIYRYCRSELLRLLREFNIVYRQRYHCAGLALEDGHWQTHPPLAVESPMYWHFEIVKKWLSWEKMLHSAHPAKRNALTLEELDDLYAHLRQSVLGWTVGREDLVYAAGVDLDHQTMRSALETLPPDAAEKRLSRERKKANLSLS